MFKVDSSGIQLLKLNTEFRIYLNPVWIYDETKDCILARIKRFGQLLHHFHNFPLHCSSQLGVQNRIYYEHHYIYTICYVIFFFWMIKHRSTSLWNFIRMYLLGKLIDFDTSPIQGINRSKFWPEFWMYVHKFTLLKTGEVIPIFHLCKRARKLMLMCSELFHMNYRWLSYWLLSSCSCWPI